MSLEDGKTIEKGNDVRARTKRDINEVDMIKSLNSDTPVSETPDYIQSSISSSFKDKFIRIYKSLLREQQKFRSRLIDLFDLKNNCRNNLKNLVLHIKIKGVDRFPEDLNDFFTDNKRTILIFIQSEESSFTAEIDSLIIILEKFEHYLNSFFEYESLTASDYVLKLNEYDDHRNLLNSFKLRESIENTNIHIYKEITDHINELSNIFNRLDLYFISNTDHLSILHLSKSLITEVEKLYNNLSRKYNTLQLNSKGVHNNEKDHNEPSTTKEPSDLFGVDTTTDSKHFATYECDEVYKDLTRQGFKLYEANEDKMYENTCVPSSYRVLKGYDIEDKYMVIKESTEVQCNKTSDLEKIRSENIQAFTVGLALGIILVGVLGSFVLLIMKLFCKKKRTVRTKRINAAHKIEQDNLV